MTGETNLDVLLATLTPELHEGEYVFCSLPVMPVIGAENIVCFFRETEAVSVIVDKKTADSAGLGYAFIASWITLKVHSSLAAVGLTAAFSRVLADANISCNVVAAYYHDHIFVPQKDAGRAMEILQKLSGSPRNPKV